MPNQFLAVPNPDGSAVDLRIAESNGKSATLAIPVAEVGVAATALLSAAIECARKSGRLAQLAPKVDPKAPQHKYLRNAHALAVSETGGDPDSLVLVFAVGGTELSIGVSRSLLATLTNVLIARGVAAKPG